MTKCPKSGKKWDNEHVNKWIMDDEFIYLTCIKCNKQQTTKRNNLIDYLFVRLFTK